MLTIIDHLDEAECFELLVEEPEAFRVKMVSSTQNRNGGSSGGPP
jgi:hypothetical protein